MNTLSIRENQVSELLAYGYTDKEVAQNLRISFDTVRTHHKNIYNKIGARNLADLTRWFFKIEPRAIGAIFLLLLTISIEFFGIQAIRPQAVKTAKTARTMRRDRSKNNLLTL